MNIEERKTNRGFDVLEFTDLSGSKCSIQKSSLATDDAIWIGIEKADPKIMLKDTPQGGTGWIKYDIPDNVLLTTRMHLNMNQVKELLPIFQRFIDTGEIVKRTPFEKCYSFNDIIFTKECREICKEER